MTEEKRTRVLLVGQNPDVFTGNGNMMGACLEDIDSEKYEVCLFAKDQVSVDLRPDPFNPETSFNAPMIQAEEKDDPWGRRKLLMTLANIELDIVVFVGLDIWRYQDIFDHIKEIQKQKGFTWKVLVPYDLDEVRDDWIKWFNYPDQVYVYTENGYRMIKDHVESAKYYRPKLRFSDIYKPAPKEDKEFVRKQIFPDVDMDTEIFCFVGNNQIRKNIYGTIRGFAEALKKRQDMILYMHLDNPESPFGIDRIKRDLDIPDDKVRHNANSRTLWPHEMAVMLSATDCHILPSFQEGLSWTVVETKLLGLPSIISYNTAHIDYSYVPCKNHLPKPIFQIKPDQVELLPLISDHGPCYLQCNSCSHTAIKKSILQYMGNVKSSSKGAEYKEKIQKNARVMGVNWLHDCHNFQTDILEDTPKIDTEDKIGEVI